jgi:hypothetical protein
VIRHGITVVARDDDLLNVNGLKWTDPHLSLIVPTYGPSSTQAAVVDLKRATMLITGHTLGPYHTWLKEQTLQLAAQRAGFRPIRQWQPGTHNTISVWERTPSSPARR